MMKKVIFGLITLTTISAFAVPVKADEVNMQNTQQISTQEGNRNLSYQRSDQSIRSSQNQYRRNPISNTGSVQDLYQDSYQEGSRNSARQINRQEIQMNRQYRR